MKVISLGDVPEHMVNESIIYLKNRDFFLGEGGGDEHGSLDPRCLPFSLSSISTEDIY